MSTSSSPEPSGRGAARGVAHVHAASASAAFMARAFEASADGLLIRNIAGYVTYANAAAERILGVPRRAMQGRSHKDPFSTIVAIDGKQPSEAERPFTRVLRSGAAVYGVEMVIERPNGEHATLLVDVAPLRDDDGQFAGTVGSFVDITQFRETAEDLRAKEERLSRIIETLTDGLLIFDVEGIVVHANTAAESILGLRGTGSIGMPFDAPPWRPFTLDGEPLPHDAYPFACVKRTGEPLYGDEVVIERDDGERVVLSVNAAPLTDAAGAFSGAVLLFTNVTERHQTAALLEDANSQLAAWRVELARRKQEMTLLSEMGDHLQKCASTDAAYKVIGQALRGLFPAASGALYILDGARAFAAVVLAWGSVSPTARVIPLEECWALRRGRVHGFSAAHSGLRCRHVDDEADTYICVPLIAHGAPIGVVHLLFATALPDGEAAPTDAGEGLQLAQSAAERASLALANMTLRESLRMHAVRDPLTGLFNRHYMEESLEREIRRAERRYASLGVIMLNIDHFKTFNDTHGHAAGDTLLQELSAFLQGHIRGEDIACRYSGEELTLILPDASLEGAAGRADVLRDRIKQLAVRHQGQPLGMVTVSLGVAAYPAHGTTGEDLLRAAAAALHDAKEQGRDRVVVARPAA